MPTAPHRVSTPRLLLRRQQPSDAAVFHRLWQERDLRVPAHRRVDSRGYPTQAQVRDHIRSDRNAPAPWLLTVERVDRGEVIGYCGLVITEHGEVGEPELAFELLQSSHNRGFATEAGAGLIDAACAMGCMRLWASVWDWNLPSLRVLDKLGFVDTGRSVGESEHGHSLLHVLETPTAGQSRDA